MHDRKAVEGLIRKLGVVRSEELRRDILATLIRLYNREADFKGFWWGIRPENIGPYFDAVEWDQSKRIGAVLKSAILDAGPDTAASLRAELARHRVSIDGLAQPPGQGPATEKEAPIVVRKADPKNPNQIGNMTYEAVVKRTLAARGKAARGKALFKSQSCNACHTDADGQALKGPHLVDIGKRYSATELAESILKPSAKIAQGFETYLFQMVRGQRYSGFIVSTSARALLIREATGVQRELKLDQIESRTIQKESMMPEGLVANLTPEELSDLIAYLQSLTGTEAPKEPAPGAGTREKPVSAPVRMTAG
jgi:putative heme-binding domain-containing protein